MASDHVWGRKDRHIRREAIFAIIAICSVTFIAAAYTAFHAGQHAGSSVNLLEISPVNVPVISLSELAKMEQFWDNREISLETEKKQVGAVLANEMRQFMSAKTKDAKVEDLRRVEILRNRFESILTALKDAPVLSKFDGPNGEVRGFDPKTGIVYQLYEYHDPGGYPDAELDLNPLLADDEKNLGDPFKDPAGRNPIYQGEYPEYAARQKTQVLYDPHVPGDYPDAELELQPDLAVDEKTLGEPFADPAGRNPTYQGEYPEYKAKVPTQVLYDPHVPGDYPDAELDLQPDLAVDEKTLGEPFADPSGRNPTYQGEFTLLPSLPFLDDLLAPWCIVENLACMSVEEGARRLWGAGEYPEYRAGRGGAMLYDGERLQRAPTRQGDLTQALICSCCLVLYPTRAASDVGAVRFLLS